MLNSNIKMQEINAILPHLEYIDNNNSDPQMIMNRSSNRATLYIDSKLGYSDTYDSSYISIASNIGNPSNGPNYLIKNARRLAIKRFELFYYIDNIIEGYNDTLTLGVHTQSPPSNETPTVTLTSGVYSVQDMADMIKTVLQSWYDTNWAPTPPTVTVSYVAPTLGDAEGLFGQLVISIDTFSPGITEVSVDPTCSFISNSYNMIALTKDNVFPIPDTLTCKLSFFGLTVYKYIDIISDTLTKDAKILNSTNTSSNYKTIHRIQNINYGTNEYIYKEPLNWINISKDTTVYIIDFRFVDSQGINIKGAITRDFNWRAEIIYEK